MSGAIGFGNEQLTSVQVYPGSTIESFKREDAWSCGAIFRCVSFTSARTLFGRVGADTSIHYYISSGRKMVLQIGATTVDTGSTNVADDFWYATVVTCNGAAAAGDLSIYCTDMAGNYLGDWNGAARDHPGTPADQTGPLFIGRKSGTAFWFTGSIAHAFYLRGEMTEGEVQAFRQAPKQTILSLGTRYGLDFYIPLESTSLETTSGDTLLFPLPSNTYQEEGTPHAPYVVGALAQMPYDSDEQGVGGGGAASGSVGIIPPGRLARWRRMRFIR